jgi:PadR family transcriptional regulator PadR
LGKTFEKTVDGIDRYLAMQYNMLMDNQFFDNWSTQLRKGMHGLCILNAISRESLYGYDIVRKLRQINGLVISEGTIYPILSRLKREGIVQTTIMESNEGPPRKYYKLTAKGKEILSKMNNYWQDIKTGTDALRREEKL